MPQQAVLEQVRVLERAKVPEQARVPDQAPNSEAWEPVWTPEFPESLDRLTTQKNWPLLPLGHYPELPVMLPPHSLTMAKVSRQTVWQQLLLGGLEMR